MKFFLALLLLGGIAYGGFVMYRQSIRLPLSINSVTIPGNITLAQSPDTWGNIANVLGESVTRAVSTGTGLVNQATNGQGGPIINQALTNLQNQVKELPAKEATQIQYNYCKTIVNDYEKKSGQ